MKPILLELRQLSVSFDARWQRPVWSGLDLQLAPAAALCIWGANGAGRSTLAKAIMGLVPSRGEICWRGASIAAVSSAVRARLGLTYVPESRDVFTYLTVLENLQLAQRQAQWVASGKRRLDSQWADYDADFACSVERIWHDFPALYARKNRLAGVLSGGEQQMLSLARAVLARPQCLVLDEVFEGLAMPMVDKTLALLLKAQAAGVALLMMEQKENFAHTLGAQSIHLHDLLVSP